MRFRPKKLLALILAGLMILPAASCADEEDSVETKDPNATEVVTDYKPDIEKTNYDCDLVITGKGNILDWIIADEDSESDAFQATLFERAMKIKDHLGVNLVEVDAGDWTEYVGTIIRTAQGGWDRYQLVSASVLQGVGELLASGVMLDFAEIEGVNLDAPYWDRAYMEDLTIQDQYLVGYNDFCLSNPCCMVFNKDLMNEYSLTAPYDDVRNMKWTLDKMISFVSNVSEDNSDNVWDERDTYGISSAGWMDFIGFVQSNDMKVVAKDAEGTYQIAYDDDNEKTLALLEKLCELYNAEYSWFSSPYTERDGKDVLLSNGKVLMTMSFTDDLPPLRNYLHPYGVVPYPLYDEKQDAYHSLNWNGCIMVPCAVQNRRMVGETLELLAYYTEPVKVAYHEDILGSKLAEAPDDAEMLEIIWNSQISDMGLLTATLIFPAMDHLLYMVPKVCQNGIDTYSSYLQKYIKSADEALDNFFSPRKRG